MLHAKQEKYLHAFARYTVLSMAAHFGVRFSVTDEVRDIFFEELSKHYSEKQISTLLKYDDKTKELIILGCPTEKLTECMKLFSFRLKRNVKRRGQNGWETARIQIVTKLL